MIQKEVAHKMSYKKTKKRNRLNTLTDIYSNFSIMYDVSKNVFFPKPKVMSTVVKITPKQKMVLNFSEFENFTRILFRNKRKIIQNVLTKEILKRINKDNDSNLILHSRAEDLKIENIIYLFKKFLQN